MMEWHAKRIVLLFLVVSLAALTLMSASLSNLQLQAGTPFPGGSNAGPGSRMFADLTPLHRYSYTLLKGILALIFLLLMVYVPARLIALVTIKRILQLLIGLAILLGMVILISTLIAGRDVYTPGESPGIPAPPSIEYPAPPLGKPPQGLVQLVLIGFVFGAGLLIFMLLKLLRRPIRIQEQIQQEAEIAVKTIKTGGDLRQAIIQCYMQMTGLLKEKQRIERSYSMTVREFEDWLALQGFPAAPVHQLTSLFERARYGTQPLANDDEKAAVESLDEIIRFCRSARS